MLEWQRQRRARAVSIHTARCHRRGFLMQLQLRFSRRTARGASIHVARSACSCSSYCCASARPGVSKWSSARLSSAQRERALAAAALCSGARRDGTFPADFCTRIVRIAVSLRQCIANGICCCLVCPSLHLTPLH